MDSAKKMILMDQNALERLKAPLTPSLDRAVSLDNEMGSILKQQDLSDRDKWTAYNQLLQRYLFKTQQAREPVKLSIQDEDAPVATPGIATPNDDPVREQLIQVVPKAYQKKADQLYRLLKRNHNAINWGDNGEVRMEGRRYQGSNIVDLIGDVIRYRKNFQPVHYAAFAALLSELNVPQDLIGNTSRWNLIQKARHTISSLRQGSAERRLHGRLSLRDEEGADDSPASVGDVTPRTSMSGRGRWESFRL